MIEMKREFFMLAKENSVIYSKFKRPVVPKVSKEPSTVRTAQN